jgi:hypothetical protein
MKYWFTAPNIQSALIGALATVVAAFIPPIVEADRHRIPIWKLASGRDQAETWERNKNCLASQQPIKAPFSQLAMSILLCPSGDVLLTQNPASRDLQNPELNQWVNFTNPQHSTALFMSPAVAAAIPHSKRQVSTQSIQLSQSSTVLCTKILEEGRLLRRVRDANGECWDETINTYIGTVIKRDKANCDANCS